IAAGFPPEQAAARLELAAPALSGTDFPARCEFLRSYGLEDPSVPVDHLDRIDRAWRAQAARVGPAEAGERVALAAGKPEALAELARAHPDPAALGSLLGEPGQEALRRVLHAGHPPVPAAFDLGRLEAALDQAGAKWEGDRRPVLEAYARTLAGSPDRVAGVSFLLELIGGRITGDAAAAALASVSRPLPGVDFQARVAAFRDLCRNADPVLDSKANRAPAFEVFAAEVRAGTPPDEAMTRIRSLSQALHAAGASWAGNTVPVLGLWSERLSGGPELEPARALLLDLLGRGVLGEGAAGSVLSVLDPVGNLTLSQRVDAFRSLCLQEGSPIHQDRAREAAFEALRKDVEAGTDPGVAAARLSRVGGDLAAAGATWSGHVTPVLTACGEVLSGGPELDPARELLARLIASGVYGEGAAGALRAVVPPAGDLDLRERVQVFEELRTGPLDQDYCREEAFEAFRRDLDGGADRRTAVDRLKELAGALEALEATMSGRILPLLESSGGLEEASRAFLLELVGRNATGWGAAGALRAVREPVGALSLSERVEAMRELCQ
ncbi:MAG: hypothetical protein AB1758_37090, partial [Candidatus Eremiobacterota bacterium]